MLIREDLYAKVSKRKGFDYDSLKAALSAGTHPLARLNLPENIQSPGAMARALQELETASRRDDAA